MKRSTHAIPIAVGAVVLIGLWELIGRTQFFGMTFPPLSEVFATLLSGQRQRLFTTAIGATASSAALGLLIGGGCAILIAATRQTLTPTRPGLDRFAAAIHAIPQIGIAPVLVIVLGRENAPVAVASIATFFPAYAAATLAFSAAAAAHQDLFTALGSNRMDRLLRLELPAALPGLFDALRLAAPGAVLGAVLGEWFGAPRGIGLIILSSSQNFDIPVLWASAVLATLMAMIGFGFFTMVQRAAARRFA